MTAHLRAIAPRYCMRCGRPATQELWVGYNTFVNAYCDTHADIALVFRRRAEVMAWWAR